MKTKKILVRSVLVLVALAALCACAWCVWYIIQYYQGQSFGDRMRTNAPDDTGSFQLERVKIPVDFDELQAMNPDTLCLGHDPGYRHQLRCAPA